MSERITYVDRSEIRPGKLAELKTAMNELVEFVEANEPDLISYDVYFSEDASKMTVIHVHATSASLEWHMKVAGPKFPRFAEFIKMSGIEIFGSPPSHLVEQLRHKAEMLGDAKVLIHEPQAGFARIPSI
jgi:quinol monooxygenase YgiN